MEITLKRKDLNAQARDKGNINLTVYDFRLPQEIINRCDYIEYKDGSFKRIFKDKYSSL